MARQSREIPMTQRGRRKDAGSMLIRAMKRLSLRVWSKTSHLIAPERLELPIN